MDLEKRVFDALITYQRDELRKRYSYEFLKQSGHNVSKEDAETLVEIVIDTFYPSIDAREKFGEYLESLKRFTNPLVLTGTFSVLLPVMIKHGAKVKQLYRISLDALHIYSSTKVNDDTVIAFTLKHYKIDESFSFTEEIYAPAYTSASREKRIEVIRRASRLTNYFKNKKLIKEVSCLLRDIMCALNRKPELLSGQISAISYINDFVGKSAAFFLKKSELEIGAYARILESIEIRYTEGFYSRSNQQKLVS